MMLTKFLKCEKRLFNPPNFKFSGWKSLASDFLFDIGAQRVGSMIWFPNNWELLRSYSNLSILWSISHGSISWTEWTKHTSSSLSFLNSCSSRFLVKSFMSFYCSLSLDSIQLSNWASRRATMIDIWSLASTSSSWCDCCWCHFLP